MAQELAEALNLDEVRFIPSANPPHKTAPNVSAEHRANMVQLAIEHNPLFKLDTRELLRTGASYTIDTLISLRNELGPDVALSLLMGTDAFTRLHTWHRWQELLDFSHLVLVQRPSSMPNQPLDKALESLLHTHYTEHSEDLSSLAAGYIHMQTITALDISSTAIRAAFHKKATPHYLMPEAVINYIQSHQLYD
jgi:nicotinate-nucleotide adenylyltransferase